MKRRIWPSVIICIICILIALLLAVPVLGVGKEMLTAVTTVLETLDTSPADEGFSCTAYDTQGRSISAFQSEKDGYWYLCVPSVQPLEELNVTLSGVVEAASSGKLDPGNNVLTDAFVQSGDRVELTGVDGTVYTLIVMQSKLTSVYIDLNNTTLSEIHANKDKKHKGNSVYIMDPEGQWNLTVEDALEIKGRGNSTWREYDKKAYQIKFDNKTDVMGMGKAKKWVLLANASDDSMMRTQLVSQMAQKFDMDFVTSFEYVDLWIEGEYLGTYLLGEKVEIGSSRLDLTNDAGALFEHDQDFYLDEDYWFFHKTLNRYFTLKEIVEEEDELIESAITDFSVSLDELLIYLYSTPSDEVALEKLSEMMDVDSFIKYYLINEYTLNRESFSTSFYWYKDGSDDVLHLGPIWDFDTCMGNDDQPYTASYGENHVLFRYLLAAPAFYERTQELLDEYRQILMSMTDRVDEIRDEIAVSAEMNYLRWNVLGQPNPKGGADFNPSFDAAADTLQNWLAGRETAFSVVTQKVATSIVSEDCAELEICFRDGNTYDRVMVALWSEKNGTDDLRWYEARQNQDGTWYCTADLSNHNCNGIYMYNVYTNDQNDLLATGRNYAETAVSPRYVLDAEVSADHRELKVYLTDTTEKLTDVNIIIWNMMDQAGTARRLPAQKDPDGRWIVTVGACAFELADMENLVIHAYGVESAGETYLQQKVVLVTDAPEHQYLQGQDYCTYCGKGSGVENAVATTPMYRLYNPNSGEHFYTGSEEERDNLIEYGWNYEGIAWHAPIFVGAPVYRMYNPNSGDHHYTMSQEEVDMLEGYGWVYEGVAWNSAANGSPQYRLYNPNADLGSHHYTGSAEERDYLVSLGWHYEGIGWYGVMN